MSKDRKPALNSTSFRNKAITFTFTSKDRNDYDIPFPFYDQMNEWKGEKKRRLGYKVNDIYYLSPETGEMESLTDDDGRIIPYETVFLTELAHNLIVSAGCTNGDKITLLFKTGKTKDGNAFSKWFLCKGDPTFNESGSVTNMKCDKDFLEKVDDEKIVEPELKVEPELEMELVTPPVVPPEPDVISKSDNAEILSQIQIIKDQIVKLDSDIRKIEQKLNEEELPF